MSIPPEFQIEFLPETSISFPTKEQGVITVNCQLTLQYLGKLRLDRQSLHLGLLIQDIHYSINRHYKITFGPFLLLPCDRN